MNASALAVSAVRALRLQSELFVPDICVMTFQWVDKTQSSCRSCVDTKSDG